MDERAACVSVLHQAAVVDAILAKRNLGTNRAMAPITVGLGPGFTAGEDVDAVVETMRGHHLGRVILQGAAIPNTGVPGVIAGYAAERVIHAPASGEMTFVQDENGQTVDIGALVCKGQEIARVGGVPVLATIDGVLRGLIRAGYPVTEGLKIADIDRVPNRWLIAIQCPIRRAPSVAALSKRFCCSHGKRKCSYCETKKERANARSFLCFRENPAIQQIWVTVQAADTAVQTVGAKRLYRGFRHGGKCRRVRLIEQHTQLFWR